MLPRKINSNKIQALHRGSPIEVIFYSNEQKSDKEILYLQKHTHRGIRSVLGCVKIGGNTGIVLEKLNKTLREHVNKKYQPSQVQGVETERKRDLYEKEVLNYALDLISVLNLFHSKGICHSNLNPETVFINQHNRLILSSLNSCIDEESTEASMNEINYSSPEQLIGNDVGEETDVWSLGCLLYFMLTKTDPYDQLEKNENCFIESIVLKKELPEGIRNDKFREILTGMMEINPGKRTKLKFLYLEIKKLLES